MHARSLLMFALYVAATGAATPATAPPGTMARSTAASDAVLHSAAPDAAAIESALTEAARHPLAGRPVANEAALVRSLYERRAMQPLWSRPGGLTAQAQALVTLVGAADRNGLDPADYAAARIAAARDRLTSDFAATGDATAAATLQAQFDAMLTVAAVRLVTHLHYGRVDPRAAGFEIKEPRTDLDVAAAVVGLSTAPRTSDALGAVEPTFYHYGLLKQALARYRVLQSDAELTHLPPIGRRPLHAGDAYEGAAALQRLLTALGDLPAAAAPAGAPPAAPPAAPLTAQPAVLDAALVEGLKHFEERHGLATDGTLGAAVFAELTTPLTQRTRQIELTLERWRWLPAFDRPPIIVNIPQFDLFAFEGTADRAAAIMTMKVIVGKAYPQTETPVFSGELRYVIFRPYWDVPRSILLREMLPAIHRDAGYLERNHLEIVAGERETDAVLAPSPDSIAALAAGRARVRQRPGEDNALGLIKFLFPNTHDVYLHSTPAHQLFAQSRRAFSHGCIRVSDPVALARYVLRKAPGVWDDAHILAALNGPDNVRVTLSNTIPVMILYGTVQATEAGPIQFFDDIYRHDARLAELLAKGRSP